MNYNQFATPLFSELLIKLNYRSKDQLDNQIWEQSWKQLWNKLQDQLRVQLIYQLEKDTENGKK